MDNEQTQWSYDEFLAYVLFYAANADLEIKPEERELIHEKVNNETYVRIKKEFLKDNDVKQLEKIRAYCKQEIKGDDAIENLLEDIKQMFLVDGKYTGVEQGFFIGLKRMLKQ